MSELTSNGGFCAEAIDTATNSSSNRERICKIVTRGIDATVSRPSRTQAYTMKLPSMPTEQQQVRYPGRIVAAVVAAILICLWGAFESYGFESAYQRQSPD